MKQRLIMIAAFLSVSLMLLWISATALRALSERKVTYDYLHEALSPVAASLMTTNWEPAPVPLTRAPSASDRALWAQSLTMAWQALAVAQETGEGDILADGFSGIALERAALSVEDSQTYGGRMAVLSQTLTPVFYHMDGSLVQLHAELVVERHLIEAGASSAAFRQISTDSAVVTMLNQSSGWRVMSYERRKEAPLTPRTLPVDLPSLQGINYYPAQTPWRDFWPQYDPAIIDADLQTMRGLGANAIRVFLQYEDFAQADPEGLPALQNLLEQAQAAGMYVVPTLFDLKGSFSTATYAQDAAYLDHVLPVLATSDAVAYIDIKNEPDLDYATHGRAQIDAWLAAMMDYTRLKAPDIPLTIGWSSAEAGHNMIADVDLVTYHDYADPSGTKARLSGLRHAALDKPVMVTEIGSSAFELALAFPGSPDAQAEDLQSRLRDLAESDGVFVWTLHDFEHIDSSVIGASPWRQKKQASFGLFNTDMTPKPAAQVVRTEFAARLSEGIDR